MDKSAVCPYVIALCRHKKAIFLFYVMKYEVIRRKREKKRDKLTPKKNMAK